jgi:hypothetical protein
MQRSPYLLRSVKDLLAQRTGQGAPDLPRLKPPAEFHCDVRYDGDLHRADLALAVTPPRWDFRPDRIARESWSVRPCLEGQRKTSA